MRKLMLVLLAGLMWLGVGCEVALADGMVLPPPEADITEYLAVRYHHVTVTIEDNHALTRVDQEFFNPNPFPVQGRYLFPVPPEAVLSRFQATVEGRPQQVIRQDPDSTNATLYAIVAQRHDPSLLQYADWESLAFDLSLAPGLSRRMSLEYEEVLAPMGGLYRYRYVLSTERYSSRPLDTVSVSVDLSSTSGLASLYSPSHPVAVDRLGTGQARVSWEAQDLRPTEDFELFFAPSEGGFGAGLLTGERDVHNHFLFLFSPDIRPGRTSILAKDIVFVMDRSGSMAGEKIRQARNALHFILGQLGEETHFSIVGFDDRISMLDSVLQPVDRRTLATARHFVSGLTPDGNTDLEAALQAGLDILARSEDRGASRMVIFLTDGLPTAGITDDTLIARLVAEANGDLEARLHVFGVGYDVNSHLLDRLAVHNGGTVTYVQPGEDLEKALTEFYGRIAYPVLTDVEIQFEGMEASELYPLALPDLFQGSSLLLVGRYQDAEETVTVRVRGRAGDKEREYVYHFDLDESDERSFVPRLWATRRIGALLDQVRVEGETETLVHEVRELGITYGLVTPYTTFVIEGQSDGAASAANMALYGLAELNQAWGQATIQARVQNQTYQEAVLANLASGANVKNQGQHTLAQVGSQNVDLSLLRGRDFPDGPVSMAWIARHVGIDQVVDFGSKEYFALAENQALRSLLQSGPNVIFMHEGQVISVQDTAYQSDQADGQDAQGSVSAASDAPLDPRRGSNSLIRDIAEVMMNLLVGPVF